jgi:hypothetical protein
MIKNVFNTYTGGRVRLDNGEFVDCQFEGGCILEYAGTGPVSLIRCKFGVVSWQFTGGAQNTFHFLRGVYHGMGEGGKALVESIFDDIRTNAFRPIGAGGASGLSAG